MELGFAFVHLPVNSLASQLPCLIQLPRYVMQKSKYNGNSIFSKTGCFDNALSVCVCIK